MVTNALYTLVGLQTLSEGNPKHSNVSLRRNKAYISVVLTFNRGVEKACIKLLSAKVLVFSKKRSPTLLSFSFHFRFLDLWVKHSIFAFVSDNTIGRDVIFPRPVKLIVISYKIWLS